MSDSALVRHATPTLESLSRNQERLAQQVEEMQTDVRRDRLLRNVMGTEPAPHVYSGKRGRLKSSHHVEDCGPQTVGDMMRRPDAFGEMKLNGRSPKIPADNSTESRRIPPPPPQDAGNDKDPVEAFKGSAMKTLAPGPFETKAPRSVALPQVEARQTRAERRSKRFHRSSRASSG